MTTEREEALELAREAAIAIGLMPALVEFGGDKEAESFAVELVRLAKQRGAEEQKRKDAEVN